MTEDHGLLALALGHDEAHLLEPGRRASRRARLDGLALRPELRRNGRVPRQVESLEHRHHGRKRQHVHVAASWYLLLAADRVTLDGDSFEAGRRGAAQRVRDPDADLVVAGVGRLVAEEDEVERPVRRLVGADRFDDRARCRLWIPFFAVGDEVNRAVDPERHRVAQLLLRLRRA